MTITGRASKNLWLYLALVPVLWVLIGFILYPTLNTMLVSLGFDQAFTLDYYLRFFTYGPNLKAFYNTIILGLATVLVCGVVGISLAFCVHSFEFPGRRAIDVFLLAPLMLPGVIMVIAFMQLYGESGLVTKTVQTLLGLEKPPFVLSGFWGILFIHAYTQYIFFYINVSAALKRLDSSVIEAARMLGASRVRIFFTVILPMLTPALVASSVLTFMSGVGSFAGPSLVGDSFRVMSVQILMSKVNNYLELAAVQGIMLSLVSVVFLLLMRWYESRREYAIDIKAAVMGQHTISSRWVKYLFMAGAFGLTLFIALPILAIFLLSFTKPESWFVQIYPTDFGWDNYIRFFSNRRVYQPFINSLGMSFLAVGAAVAIGSISSYLIIKTRMAIKWLIEILVLLPWALPSSTVAINMINAFNQPTPFSLGQILVGSYWLLPLTYFVGMLTLVVRSTNASLLQLHDSVEEASRILGAGWFTTFRKIVVPIVLPGIMAGGLLGFIGALGDYTASALMYNIHNRPISIAMTNAMFDFNIGLSMTYGVIQILITLAVIVLVKKLGRVGDFSF